MRKNRYMFCLVIRENMLLHQVIRKIDSCSLNNERNRPVPLIIQEIDPLFPIMGEIELVPLPHHEQLINREISCQR